MKAALLAAGFVLLLGAGVMTVTQLGHSWKSPCALVGPAPQDALPPDAGGSVHETRSWWPIGSTCEWKRADGAGTVESHVGDIGLTLATYGLAAGGALSLGVGVRGRRETRGAR